MRRFEGLKTAVALDPGKALYHHGLGSVYARVVRSVPRQAGVPTGAMRSLKQAIELNPLDSRLLGLLGQAVCFRGASFRCSGGISTISKKSWLRAAHCKSTNGPSGLRRSPLLYRYEQARLYWMLGERSDG
jgi:hypothetical protein